MSEHRLDARLALLMTIPPLLWAGNAVVGRYASEFMSPLMLNLLRWTGAGLLLAPLGWRILASADSRQRIVRHAGHLACLSLLGVGAFNALQYTALQTTTAINATLVLSCAPMFSVMLGALFFGQPVRAAALASVVLSILAVLLVISGGRPQAFAQLRFVAGDLYMLAASFGWSLYTWMLAKPPATLKPSGQAAWTWAEFLWLQIVIGGTWAALITATAAGLSPTGLRPTAWSWGVVACVAYVVIFPSLVAYRCWGLGVARAGPTLTLIFSNLNPLFSALLSAALLGEPPGWHHALAFGLIGAGIAISARPSTSLAKSP